MLPFERLQKSNTINNLWCYILVLLKERELYGYEIPKLIKEKFNFRPGKITPYRVLYRLENEGFVKSEIKNKERKKFYRITEKGENEIKKTEKFYKTMLEIIK